MKIRTLDKATRALIALDAARCNGNWHEVPELVQKVAKRSPEKKCLIQTARAECRIAEHLRKSARPTTSGEQTDHGLVDLIPVLLSAMQEQGSSQQDIFQAQVCLGWLHWSLSEPALASSRLPRDFEATLQSLTQNNQPLSPWTEVSVIKAGYIKAAAQALTSGSNDALQTLGVVSNWASESLSQETPQHAYWSEQFLAKSALISSNAATTQEPTDPRAVDFAMTSFRAWASHPEVKKGDPTASTAGDTLPGSPGPRSSIWKAYYQFLSVVLQRRLPLAAPSVQAGRTQLSSEFRCVETVCENMLLRTVKFPRAHMSNKLVEEWVEQVIRNWEVLCGPEWTDDDFGEGGQDAISRNVLDILYRASTKTFHSTLILRRLFHVHAALAEFDLAMKAFDTYVDLVTNAKHRAEQAERQLDNLEDEETFIRILSEGVILLCCFRPRKEAEKAKQLADQLESLLSTLAEPVISDAQSGSDAATVPRETYTTKGGKSVSVSVVSTAYYAVGVGLANWARWTPINESRTGFQESAATALEKSLEIGSDSGPNPSSAFALGLLLAEMRDLDGAVGQVRSALMPTTDTPDDAPVVTYSEGQNLTPLWHLLVLLLSARQDFKRANEVCEAAASDASVQQTARPPSIREGSSLTIGIQDTKSRQKEGIVELKMTQLALTETLHGPEAALNHSDELFELFASLFRGLGVSDEEEEKGKPDRLAPPKTSSGKSRSFRGSLFSRRKGPRPDERDSQTRSNGTASQRPSTGSRTVRDTPAIQVSSEETRKSTEHPESPRHDDDTSSRKSHRRHTSLAVKVVKGHGSEPSSGAPSPSRSQGPKENEYLHSPISSGKISPTAGHNNSLAARQPLPPVPHNMKLTKEPLPLRHTSQPPKQDIRLPAPTSPFEGPTRAIMRFPRIQARRHALGLLVKVWLFISGIYRRASLFDDANEALNEAWEQGGRVESLVAEHESSARALADAGWGCSKSSDEVWADIFTEAGLLAEAQSRPHDAITHFEEALVYWPDHPRATVGLANLLLKIYDESLPAEAPQPEFEEEPSDEPARSSCVSFQAKPVKGAEASGKADTPEKLNRLAARDRAYGLLSTLTKLGSAWDDSEAWFALSKAYEQGGQVEKAREILWWCVELEDRRPIRHWWNVGIGGYVI